MKKTKVIAFVITLCVLAGIIFLLSTRKTDEGPEQIVLEQTLELSKTYAVLHYQTEKVLLTVAEYEDYDAWIDELGLVIVGWQNLEQKALELEKNADMLVNEDTSVSLIKQAQAYSTLEIQKVIESAPMGKQVRTLAKHLGVDAKMAQLILNQTQDQITREAYGMEGDVFETCEQNSMRIKNGAKVTVFVGGVVLTGGMAGVAASGAVAKTALVVGGADLVLEVADDEAKIALGDKNKVSEMVGKVRTITEPAASILTIANMPGNVSKAMEKISALSFAGDQIRSVVQDEKILGISIKINEAGEQTASAAGLNEEELPEWMAENNIVKSGESVDEFVQQVKEEVEKINKEEINKEEGSQTEEKKEDSASRINLEDIPNQIYRVVNVSNSIYMMDACFNPTCWDDLDANPAEDRDLGGIYTLGKVYGNGEGFRSGFRPSDIKRNSQTAEMLADGYRITVYFAIAPFEGPKHKTINYGTWENHSVEINAKYGDEPIIEWDGSSLRQVK